MTCERSPSLLFPFLVAMLSLSVPGDAAAQVTTNLSDLPPAPEAAHRSSHAHPSFPSGHTASRKAQLSSSESVEEHKTPAGYTTIPNVPNAPPAPTILAPPFTPVPTHPSVAPDSIEAVPTANSRVVPYQDSGLRILFTNASSEMNADTIHTIQHYGANEARHIDHRLVLHSYATLPGDDLSMPRRIALARALAVRSLLIQSGIATTRIYPLAEGRPNADDHNPADRLDIVIDENPDSAAATSVSSPDTLPSGPKGAPTP